MIVFCLRVDVSHTTMQDSSEALYSLSALADPPVYIGKQQHIVVPPWLSSQIEDTKWYGYIHLYLLFQVLTCRGSG